jgi:UDPglucose--hexose-1-phosphate uridylyltransferase
MNGVGAHEVIIETPEHKHDLVDMTDQAVRDVLWSYRERMADLERDIRFKHIIIFKNYGEAAGASLEHSHSQLIATPIVPKRVMEEVAGAKRYHEYKERCIFCDIVRQELSDKERIVRDHDAFIAFVPFASRFPFETCIIPKSHQSSFLEMSDSEYTVLARCMKDTLLRIKLALNNPPFNYVLHTRPLSREYHDYYHWHIEIIPRLTRTAGFEWGTGFYINPTPPEESATFLREIVLKPQTVIRGQQASGQ